MIIIIAAVVVRPERIDEAMESSVVHVRRSRQEPGCISHGVHVDGEDPNRLVFVERWADREAMERHFAVPEARAFARALGEMSDSPAEMNIYEASPLA